MKQKKIKNLTKKEHDNICIESICIKSVIEHLKEFYKRIEEFIEVEDA